jgi:hypothetical protein
MGLAPAAIAYLMIEGKRREFSGSVLTLGVQNVFMTQDQFEKLAHSLSYNLNPAPTKLTKLPLIEGQITCEYALLRLGFSDVVATDANDFEDADFLFDLNDEKVPDVHRGVYDLVIDSGTLEHVFHLPNALRNVVNFASDGGRVIHLSPSSNHIDHGFYMFSPTLFWDFYSVNEQEIIACELFRYYMPEHDSAPWIFGQYSPGSLDKHSMGGLGGGSFGVAVLVQRTREIEKIIIPQQGMYVSMWDEATKTVGPKRRTGIKKVAQVLRESFRAFRRKLMPSYFRLRVRTFKSSFPLKVSRKL